MLITINLQFYGPFMHYIICDGEITKQISQKFIEISHTTTNIAQNV